MQFTTVRSKEKDYDIYLEQGWANFSERGPDETFGSSPRAEITNKNPEVTIT